MNVEENCLYVELIEETRMLREQLARVELASKELIACAARCLVLLEHDNSGTDKYAFAWQVRAAIECAQHALHGEVSDLQPQVQNGEK
jgi:hypothetical protein